MLQPREGTELIHTQQTNPHELSPDMKGNKVVKKLQKQARAICDTLASTQKTLYRVNNPETYLELGLADVSADFNAFLEYVRAQERQSPYEIENAERRNAISDLPRPAVLMVSSLRIEPEAMRLAAVPGAKNSKVFGGGADGEWS